MSKQATKPKIERAKISLPLETSIWIRTLQEKHRIPLSLSQIVTRGMNIARPQLTTELSRK